ncbi:MAG: addiction module protein [Bacteroidales bacterium]|nr:addiction module protein [Bacteroidales bacterium]
MKQVMTEIKNILKLSIDERIHLVQTIWDSIAADTEVSEISEEHKKILDERLEAHKNNPNDVVSWDEVKKSVKKIL